VERLSDCRRASAAGEGYITEDWSWLGRSTGESCAAAKRSNRTGPTRAAANLAHPPDLPQRPPVTTLPPDGKERVSRPLAATRRAHDWGTEAPDG